MKRTLLCALILSACGQANEPPPVRDVRPTTVELGEKLIVETRPDVVLEAGAPTTVELVGTFVRPGQPNEARTLVLSNARATAPTGQKGSTRILADIDPLVEETVGGHARFYGSLRVLQRGQVVADSGHRRIELDLFPRTARKLAYHLVGSKQARDLVTWLGVEVKQVPREAGQGSMLEVVKVRQAFNAIRFISDHDCGIWDEKLAGCRAPLDGKVSTKEAAARGFDLDLFTELDENGDGQVDRHEAHEHDRPASPAAVAGLRKGDLIVAAGGHDIKGLDDFADVWMRGEGATIPIGVVREGKPLEPNPHLPRYGRPASVPEGFLLGGILFAVGLLVILPVPVIGGLIVVWERKLAGRMQSRPGPNRVGPGGWLQWLADGLKLIVKEDVIPTEADPILFRASPYLVFGGVFATFVVLPFSQTLIVADLNIGILYLLSVTSLVVVGIIMGGWASNSKWSLLGGMRSAAQIISYELPASIAILSVVTLAGTLSTQGLVLNQGGAPWNWHLFDNPFTFVCFVVYFISALAEGNRTPFDLPEAESELVAGYNTEYSGFRFSIFFLAEWVNLVVIGAVATTVFLGGWRIPGVSPEAIEASLWLQLLSAGVFVLKVTFLVFVIIWIRWTLPRFRVDQMMNMCWKYFLPFSLACFIASTLVVWALPYPSIGRLILRWAMFAIVGLGTLGWFISRVRYTQKTTKVLELRGA